MTISLGGGDAGAGGRTDFIGSGLLSSTLLIGGGGGGGVDLFFDSGCISVGNVEEEVDDGLEAGGAEAGFTGFGGGKLLGGEDEVATGTFCGGTTASLLLDPQPISS